MTGNLTYIYAALAVLTVLFVFMAFQYVLLHKKMNRLYKKYRYFMTGDDGVSVERKLSAEVQELRTMTQSAEEMVRQQEVLSHVQDQAYQKIGLVKYDAFDDTGDKLSFSLTLLDGTNNGFVLSTLVGRENSRIYAKKINAGQCAESLSSEEAESINMALSATAAEAAPMVKTASKKKEEEKKESKKKAAEKKENDPFHEFAFLREKGKAASQKSEVKNEASGK